MGSPRGGRAERFPEAATEGKDGYLSLDATPNTYSFINGFKELKAAKDNQQCEIDAVRHELNELKNAANGRH